MEDSTVHPIVPEFVWQIIEDAQSTNSESQLSFVDIVDRLKRNHFQIMSGVDSEEVSRFVSWVASSEQSGAWE
jgi:hypothetical protein